MKYECAECGKKFKKERGLNMHKTLMHKNQKEVPDEKVTNAKTAFSEVQASVENVEDFVMEVKNKLETLQELLGY